MPQLLVRLSSEAVTSDALTGGMYELRQELARAKGLIPTPA